MPDESSPQTNDLLASRQVTALRNVLSVISESRADEQPVFDTILENACALCNAPLAGLILGAPEDEVQTLAAHKGMFDAAIALFESGQMKMDPDLSYAARSIIEGRLIVFEDMGDSDLYRAGSPVVRSMVDASNIRSVLFVPMIRGGVAIGNLTLFRREVSPFEPSEISLVEAFAEQAVIAIENVRQFREVRDRLERETATKDILQVISRSRDDERPVFQAIVDNAARLLDARDAGLMLVNEAGTHCRLMASVGANPETFEIGLEVDLSSPLQSTSAIRLSRIINIPDIADDPLYEARDPIRVRLVEVDGIRSRLSVPLLKDGVAFGCINLGRGEVRPFTETEIGLIETFAAQAVIAIDNVRQFREVQTRLEREAATKDVLQVISQSRDDEQPVFETILRNAARLCNAPDAALLLLNESQTGFRAVASRGARVDPEWEWALDDPLPIAQCFRDGCTVHIEDMQNSAPYLAGDPTYVRMVDEVGFRTRLCVPLIQDGAAFGVIALSRHEKRPFDAGEIALIETFAAQAVIAIENVQQFREVQTRLEREQASAEILAVISQSRDDEQPVLETIVRNAARLTNAYMVGISLTNEAGTHLSYAATWGPTSTHFPPGFQFDLSGPLQVAVSVREARTIHTTDLADDPLYEAGDPVRRKMVDEVGVRSFLTVPLVRNGRAFGCLNLNRNEVWAFTPDEIQLIETFAAQAVIAIENVRQFREIQNRLERERISAEILKLISQSREDERPVFDAILEKATAVCQADQASMVLVNEAGTHIRLVADWGHDTAAFHPGTEWPIDQPLSVSETLRTGTPTHIHDYAQSELYKSGDPVAVRIVDIEGIRTRLAIPLLKDGQTIGVIGLSRRIVKPFTDADIQLVETFAAQAVIAIENVRQFREVQDRLERETASSEVLEIISTSRDSDLPVFDKITQAVSQLCDAPLAYICVLNEARTHVGIPAQIGARPEFAERLSRFWEPVENDWLMAVKAAVDREVIRIDDLAQDALYLAGNEYRVNMVDEEGMRSVLAVPLVSRSEGVGCIFLYRREVAPFTDVEMEVVRSFAAQAVIAIENVRQYRQLESRLAREAASRDILQIISQSRGDDTPVFDAILGNAARLCRAPMAWLLLTNETQTVMTLAAYHGLPRRALELGSTWSINRGETQTGLGTALFEARSVQDEDLAESEAYRAGDPSVVQLVDEEGLRTRLSVPLVSGGRCIGVIVLSRREVSPFSEEDAGLVDTFAEQAVIAIENVRQYKALEALNAELGDRVEEQVGEIERMGKLKRFLPAAVADTVVSSGSEDMLKSHRALLGVLFCDIRGFTAFCETAEPEETIEVLQTYHEEMGKLINDHSAGVDHRMGDGIMVLFNDPVPCDDPAGTAVRLAQAMQARMTELCAGWKRLGHRLGFGVGISLGYATVGMVGYEGRSDYTASGTAVNLAARLCDMAENGEILLSARAAVAVEDDLPVEAAGEVVLKGIREPVQVFRLGMSQAENA